MTGSFGFLTSCFRGSRSEEADQELANLPVTLSTAKPVHTDGFHELMRAHIEATPEPTHAGTGGTSSSSPGAEMMEPGKSFNFEGLPVEVQEKVLQYAAMLPERKDANAALQNFRQTSKNSNALVSDSPSLQHEAAILQRSPHTDRAMATWLAINRTNVKLPQAIAENRHYDISKWERNNLGQMAAFRDLQNGVPRLQNYAENDVTDPGIIQKMNRCYGREDFKNGVPSSKIAADNELGEQDMKEVMRPNGTFIP